MRAFGAASYAVFALSLLVLAAFLGDLGPLWHIDGPPRGPGAAWDAGLIGLFALQHSGMARRGWKRALAAVLPPAAERSSYVLVSSLAVIGFCALWRPVPGMLWQAGPATAALIGAAGLGGLALAGRASFAIDHAGLFGLRQSGVWTPPAPEGFVTPFPYRLVRHPIYLGTLILLWAVPAMSLGHLIFSAGLSAYTLLGAWLEERDLAAQFGESYRRYQAEVPMLLPRWRG